MLPREIELILEHETDPPRDPDEDIFFEDEQPHQQYRNLEHLLNFVPDFGHDPNLDDDLPHNPHTEILAFYRPFHFHHHTRPWGIYLKRSGIDLVRRTLMGYAAPDGYDFEHDVLTITQIATKKLLLHEIKHHAIEIAFTRQEFLTHQNDLFEQYIINKNQDQQRRNNTEAICNLNVSTKSSALRITSPNQVFNYIQDQRPNVTHTLNFREYVTRFMQNQPEGYRDFQTSPKSLSAQLQSLGILEDGEDENHIRKDFRHHSNLSIIDKFHVPLFTI